MPLQKKPRSHGNIKEYKTCRYDVIISFHVMEKCLICAKCQSQVNLCQELCNLFRFYQGLQYPLLIWIMIWHIPIRYWHPPLLSNIDIGICFPTNSAKKIFEGKERSMEVDIKLQLSRRWTCHNVSIRFLNNYSYLSKLYIYTKLSCK